MKLLYKNSIIAVLAFFAIIPTTFAEQCIVKGSNLHQGYGYNEQLKWIDMDKVSFDHQNRRMRGEATFGKNTVNGVIAFDHDDVDTVNVSVGQQNSDGTYPIYGHAFSPQIGWIYFDDSIIENGHHIKVFVDTEEYLSGQAWNDNVGWIRFDKQTMGAAYTFNFDFIDPEVTWTDNVSQSPVQTDTISANINDGIIARWKYHNPNTDGDTCSSNPNSYNKVLDINDEGNISFDITTEQFNNNYICIYVEDEYCNSVVTKSSHPLNIDQTPPNITLSNDFEGETVNEDTINAFWDDAVVQKAMIYTPPISSVTSSVVENPSCPDDKDVYEDFENDEKWAQQSIDNNENYLCIYGEDEAGNKKSAISSNSIDITNLQGVFINNTPQEDSYISANNNTITLNVNSSTDGNVWYWFDPLGQNVGYDVKALWNADQTDITELQVIDTDGNVLPPRDDLLLGGLRTANAGDNIEGDIYLPASNLGQSGINGYEPEAPYIDGLGVLSVKLPGEELRTFNISAYTRGALDDKATREIKGKLWVPGAGYITLQDAKVQTKGVNKGAISGYGWSANAGYIYFEHPSIKHNDEPIPMMYIDPQHANTFVNKGTMQDADGNDVDKLEDITDYLRGEVYSPTLGLIRLAPDTPSNARAQTVDTGIDPGEATGAMLTMSHHFDTPPEDVDTKNSVSPAGFVYFDLNNVNDVVTNLDITSSEIDLDSVVVEYNFDDAGDVNGAPLRMVHEYDSQTNTVPINRREAFLTEKDANGESTGVRRFALIDIKFRAEGVYNNTHLTIEDTDHIKCSTSTASPACVVTSDGHGNFVIKNVQISSLEIDPSNPTNAKIMLNAPDADEVVQAPHSEDPYLRNALQEVTILIDDKDGNISTGSFVIANYEPILQVSKNALYNDGHKVSKDGQELMRLTLITQNLSKKIAQPLESTLDSISLPHTIKAGNESLPIPIPDGGTPEDVMVQFDSIQLPGMEIKVYDQYLNFLNIDVQIPDNASDMGVANSGVISSDYIPLQQIASNEGTVQPAYISIKSVEDITLTAVAIATVTENSSLDTLQMSEILPEWVDMAFLTENEDRENVKLYGTRTLDISDIYRTISQNLNKGRIVVFVPNEIKEGEEGFGELVPKLMYFNDIAKIEGDTILWEFDYKENYTVDWYVPNFFIGNKSCNDLDPSDTNYESDFENGTCSKYIVSPKIQQSGATAIEYELRTK